MASHWNRPFPCNKGCRQCHGKEYCNGSTNKQSTCRTIQVKLDTTCPQKYRIPYGYEVVISNLAYISNQPLVKSRHGISYVKMNAFKSLKNGMKNGNIHQPDFRYRITPPPMMFPEKSTTLLFNFQSRMQAIKYLLTGKYLCRELETVDEHH